MRIAAVKLPASSLLATVAASLLSLVVCLVVFLHYKFGREGWLAPSHPAALLIRTIERFLLAPPRSGLARIVAPNERKCCQAATSDRLQIILRNNWLRRVAQTGRAAFGMCSMSLTQGGWQSDAALHLLLCTLKLPPGILHWSPQHRTWHPCGLTLAVETFLIGTTGSQPPHSTTENPTEACAECRLSNCCFLQHALHSLCSHCCLVQVRWAYAMPVCVMFVSSMLGIIFNLSADAIIDHSQWRTLTRILSPSSTWRPRATESQYSFYRMGWVNLESESTTVYE